MLSVYISVTEKLTTYLNKENHPCQDYHDDSRKNHQVFVNCSKKVIWQHVKDRMKCIWQPLKTFVPEAEASSMTPCRDRTSAKNVQNIIFDQIDYFVNSPWLYGCPTPCKQTHFSYEIQYFHKNADTQFYDEVEGVFYISVFYKSLELEEFAENLVYDTGAFLAATGGNLGLLLGLSGMSMLLYLIKKLKKYLQNFEG